MNSRLHLLLLFTVSFALLRIQSVFAKPTWTFSVVVAVEKQTADYYQNAYGKDINQLVQAQMATVNANFNNSTSHFNGIYDFRVDSVYVFDGPSQNEVVRPHPRFTYCIVVDGKFTTPTVGGGWWGDNQTIFHSWDWYLFDGPFGSTATDGLTHEFGHARGGVDIYGMRVEGSTNPVSGETFEPVNSIMNFPYGNIVWDEYTTNLLNSTAGDPIVGNSWILDPFPGSIGIKTVDSQGQPLGNVKLEVFPVNWFSYSVSATSVLSAASRMNGVYTFSSNPFLPGSTGYPWLMRYANFLIKASYNSVVVYKWMPLYDVQNAFFRNGANSVFNLEIQFPDVPRPVKLTSINATSLCSEANLEASFTVSGSFDSDNQFYLQIVDQANNALGVCTVNGTSGGTLSGYATGLSSGTYWVRVVSSKPYTESNSILITIKAVSTPGVQPIVLCQNSKAQSLQAVGQNLLWYTMPSGGEGSSTAPIPNTSLPGLAIYFVTQTVDGCESLRAAIQVTINTSPKATLMHNGPLTASQTSATLTAGCGLGYGCSYIFDGPGILSQNRSTGQAIANVSGTYSVTVSSWGNCVSTASVALAGTDLSPTLVLPQSNFGTIGADRVRNFVVNIFEVAGLPTATGQVTMTITVPTGYTISFDGAQTSIEVSGAEGEPVSVDNPRWQISNEIAGQQLTLTMKSGERITGAGQSVVGFQIVRTTANSGSVSSITVNVTDDASKAYDGDPANNVYARIISGL